MLFKKSLKSKFQYTASSTVTEENDLLSLAMAIAWQSNIPGRGPCCLASGILGGVGAKKGFTATILLAATSCPNEVTMPGWKYSFFFSKIDTNLSFPVKTVTDGDIHSA